MNVRETMREHQKAATFWNSLDSLARGELGDAFVLGDFDWRDWFHANPSSTLLNEVDRLRILDGGF